MLIELLGPSGAGKTTALAAAGNGGNPAAWIGPDEVTRRLGGPPSAADLRRAAASPQVQEIFDRCISLTGELPITANQKFGVLDLLRRSCHRWRFVREHLADHVTVDDELLLHRAFSLLVRAEDPAREAQWFFDLAPAPDAAVLVWPGADAVVERATGRGPLPNVYQGLSPEQLHEVVERSQAILDVAESRLASRGVQVRRVSLSGDAQDAGDQVVATLRSLVPVTAPGEAGRPTDEERLVEQLTSVSGSFRKGAGRHTMRTQDVAYCAFTTPAFSVPTSIAQRDASRRLSHFGMDRSALEGRTVLDLGANAGAMLFQASNEGIERGLGIEFDADKVAVADEIAAYAGLTNIQFRAGDIDELDGDELGRWDVVLALAIESHVQDPDRLYRLLGQVTGHTLCFEGNNRCDMDNVRRRLSAAGFTDFTDLGFCSDDRDPRNNTRPQLLAHKAPGRRRFFRRRP